MAAGKHPGQIIPKGDGVYLVRMYLGRIEGKRKYASKQVRGTIAQAQRELTAMLRGKDTHTYVAPSHETLIVFLDRWLKTKGVSAGTRHVYGTYITRFIRSTPRYALAKLSALTPQLIREFYGSLSSDHDLMPRSIRFMHGVLRGALQQAVDDGILLRNPCDGARSSLPKKRQAHAGTALTLEQTAHLIDHALTVPRWGILYYTMLVTGLRVQEVLGVKWSDLQDDGSVLIQRAWKSIGKGRFELSTEMKTETSRRRVVLSEKLRAQLQVHRQEQLRDMLKRGAAYQRNDFMFAMPDGRAISPWMARYHWKRLLKGAGLPTAVRLYDSRHTHLTQALEVAHPKAVADRSGHGNPDVLLNTYAHTLPAVAQGIPDAIERRLDDARHRTHGDVSDRRLAGL